MLKDLHCLVYFGHEKNLAIMEPYEMEFLKYSMYTTSQLMSHNSNICLRAFYEGNISSCTLTQAVESRDEMVDTLEKVRQLRLRKHVSLNHILELVPRFKLPGKRNKIPPLLVSENLKDWIIQLICML